MAVNATAAWRARPSGNNNNGGGYDAGIAGAATDYSQQNAAQATGTHGTATGTTTFTDTVAANFTPAMIGNAIWIASGAGFTVGAYFVTGFGSSTSVTLDRSPGTGTVAAWALGGGWADFWTNTTSSGPLVGGNTVYILGSGTPNPSSYVFDYTATGVSFTPTNGSSTAGRITFANDPATPGYKAPPDTTGGMPCISYNGNPFIGSPNETNFSGLWGVSSGGSSSMINAVTLSNIFGCVCDLSTFNGGNFIFGASSITVLGCEAFSSGAPGSGGVVISFVNGANGTIVGCNVHDTIGGILITQNVSVTNTIVAKNVNTDGIAINMGIGSFNAKIINCTIDGNGGNGIIAAGVAGATDQSTLDSSVIINNIISNHTGVGKAGLSIPSGSAALNSSLGFADFNVYYNNTASYTNINAGPHDIALGSDPYVAQSTENYTLA